MAKLSAHGEEVARLVKVEDKPSKDGKYRTTISIRNDRVILHALATLQSNGKLDNDFGWKVKGRVSQAMWGKQWIEQYIERLKRAGYTVEVQTLSLVA